MDLDPLGVPDELRQGLDLLLRNSVATLPGVRAMTAIDLDLQLRGEARRELAGCRSGPTCALRLGRAGGADVVIFGAVAALGHDFSLTLRAIHVADGRELGRQHADVSGSRDQLIPAVRLAAYRLLAPQRVRGALAIEADAAGVAVDVDGHSRGLTPLPGPIDDLAPGLHQVVLRRAGYLPFAQAVQVRPFATTRLQMRLRAADAQEATPAP